MKIVKNSSSLILIMLFALMVSCSTKNVNNSDNTFTGKLEVLEMSTFMYGTHILVDKNNDIICAVKSESEELSNFEGEQVIITGSKIDGYPLSGGPIFVNAEKVKVTK